MKRLIIITAMVVIGCAASPKYGDVLDTYVGAHIDQLVERWGVPDGSHTLADGSMLVQYKRRGSWDMTDIGYGVADLGCTTVFTADDAGVIRSWSYEGNNCQ